MAPTAQSTQATGTRLEFTDRLRGYRFAAELRHAGEPGMSVRHTEERVLVDLPGSKPTEAAMAELQLASGAVVKPLVVVAPTPPRRR
jgi:hypothetical protein